MAPYYFALSPYFCGNGVTSAIFGGLLLGSSVAFKASVIGDVLGVSGSTRSCLCKPTSSPGSLAFLVGLVVAGAIMAKAYGGLEPMPSLPTEDRVRLCIRMAVGGVLVGLGTAFGNGCTSGHGLTGLARLSLRSWVAVPTFMAAGVLTATLAQTGRSLPADAAAEAGAPQYAVPVVVSLLLCLLLLLLGVACHRLLRGQPAERLQWLRAAAELLAGLTFGAGLVISTMARPSKVAAFLDLGSGAWDFSLCFVMGSALMVTFPFYQVYERKGPSAPVLDTSFHLPPKTKPVDRELVAGAVLFGIGWGVCGVCPGPMWVIIGARPSLEIMFAILGMLIGMTLWVARKRLNDRRAANTAAASDAGTEKGKATQTATVEDVEEAWSEHGQGRPVSARGQVVM